MATQNSIQIDDVTFDGTEQTLTIPSLARYALMKGTGAGGWSLMHESGGAEFPWAQNEVTRWMPVGGQRGATWIVKGTNTEHLFITWIVGIGG